MIGRRSIPVIPFIETEVVFKPYLETVCYFNGPDYLYTRVIMTDGFEEFLANYWLDENSNNIVDENGNLIRWV